MWLFSWFCCFLILSKVKEHAAFSGESDTHVPNLESSGSGFGSEGQGLLMKSNADTALEESSTVTTSELESSSVEPLLKTTTLLTSTKENSEATANSTNGGTDTPGIEHTNTQTASSQLSSSTRDNANITLAADRETTTVLPQGTDERIFLNISSNGNYTHVFLSNLEAGKPYDISIISVVLVPHRVSQNSSNVTVFTEPDRPSIRCHDDIANFHLEWVSSSDVTPSESDIYPLYRFKSQNISFYDAYHQGANITKSQCLQSVKLSIEAGPWNKLLVVTCHADPVGANIYVSQVSTTSIEFNLKSEEATECENERFNIFVNGNLVNNETRAPSFQIGDLNPGQKYTICISTHIGDKTSNLSCLSNFTRPSAIRNIELETHETSVMVSFSPPVNETLAKIVVVTELALARGHTDLPNEQQICAGNCLTATQKDIHFTALAPGSDYTLTTYGVAGVWKSEQYSVQFTTNETVPGQPGQICSRSESENQLTIGWRNVEYPNGYIVMYNISYVPWDEATNNFQQIHYEEANNFSAVLSSLNIGTCYKISVSAINGAGQGAFSPAVLLSTSELAASKPSELNIGPVLKDAFNVTWSPPVNYTGVIIKYLLQLITSNKVVKEVTFQKQNLCDLVPCCTAKNLNSLTLAGSCTDDVPAVLAVPPVLDNKTSLIQKEFRENGSYSFTGLLPFTTYQVQVQAYTSAGGGPWLSASVKTKPSIPGEPQNFQAMSVNATTIELKWDAPTKQSSKDNSNILYYSLKYRISEATSSISINISVDKHIENSPAKYEYTLTNLHIWTNYNFSIEAWNSEEHGPSAEAFTRTDEYVPTSAVTDIEAVNVTSTSITLVWNPPSTPNGVIILYTVFYFWEQYSCDVTHENMTDTLNTSINIITIDNLKTFWTYSFQITAWTSKGRGNETSDVFSHQTDSDAPSKINSSMISVSSLTPKSVNVIWEEPCPSNGIINQYVIEYKLQGDTTKNKVLKTEAIYVVIFELQPYTAYTLRIAARVDDKQGNFSDWVPFHTDQDIPSAPVILNKTSINSTTIWLQWIPPDKPNGILLGYKLSFNATSNSTTMLAMDANFTDILVVGLHPWTLYHFTLTAYTEVGRNSTIFTQRTMEDVPSMPKDFRALYRNSTIMNLYWSPPVYSNGIIKGYFLRYYTTVNHQDVIEIRLDSTANRVTLNHMQYWTNYTFELNAYTSAGNGSAIKAFNHTDEYVPTTKLVGIDAINITSTSIEMSWHPSSEPNGHIINHIVKYTFRKHDCNINGRSLRKKDEMTIQLHTNDSRTTVWIVSLFKYWQYSFQIKACTIKGCGHLWSDEYTVTTSEDRPDPVDEKEVEITSTENSLQSSWKPPCFPNGIIQHYIIKWRKSVELNEYTNNTIGNEPKWTISNLLPYMEYEVQIAAHTILTGIYTAWKKKRTEIAVPKVPTDVTAEAKSAVSIYVKWNRPNPMPGPTTYKVSTFDKVQEKIINSSCTSLEYDKTFCTVENLKEYWNYTFHVIASTEKGSSGPSKDSSMVTTKQSTPGKVSQFTVSQELNVTKPRELTVKWKSPSLADKNGIIRSYYLIFEALNINVSKVVPSSNQGEHSGYTESQIAQAGLNYTVKICAETEVGKGVVKLESIKIQSGDLKKVGYTGLTLSVHDKAPLKPDETTQPLVTTPLEDLQSINKEQEIVITLPLEFLCGDKQGKTTRWGIIVAEALEASHDSQFFGTKSDYQQKLSNNYTNWESAQKLDRMPPYRATDDEWKPCGHFNRDISKRSAEENENNFIVGADRECRLARSRSSYCNGYLKPGREYRVKVFSCTDGGCTETQYSAPIPTDAIKKSHILQIAGGVVGSFIAVFILIVIVVIKRRRKLCFSVKQTDSENREMSQITYEKKASLDSIEVPRTRPVKVSDFSNYYQDMSSDSNLKFSEEYKLIKSLSPKHCVSAAELSCNRVKNRFTNILPFDQSRVKLLPLEDEDGSDYINANYLPGNKSRREYIACQGPLPFTKDDFWRMVWEQNVSIIVMLTQCVERGKVKCEQYWPNTTEPVYAGELILQMHSESTLPNYVIRVIELKLGTKRKVLKHFHFLKWPDFGCPETTWVLINFVVSVQTHIPHVRSGPILVHCSAGVGRTGTFISLDRLLKQLKTSDSVDIFGLVLELREYRCNMVQTEDQYVFIHECVKDILDADSDSGEEEYEPDENPLYENVVRDPIYANSHI